MEQIKKEFPQASEEDLLKKLMEKMKNEFLNVASPLKSKISKSKSDVSMASPSTSIPDQNRYQNLDLFQDSQDPNDDDEDNEDLAGRVRDEASKSKTKTKL